MSDDEYYEEEVTSNTSKKGDDAFAKAKVGAKKGELDEQLREYIGEWRKQRAKEEEELKRMKDKQAKRKEIRAEQGGSFLDGRYFVSDHVIFLCSSSKQA
jgi:troponin T